ncbi:hypothetical protein A2U01_0040930, partial [Trifolium medium]|nr:hypothetical protein [Trifolium medium]
LSLQKEAFVSEVAVREDEVWSWNLVWRRRLFRWEEDSFNELVALLELVRLSHVEDRWRWSFDPNGCFSVKSAYESISKDLVVDPILSPYQAMIFARIWESAAPSKVIAFSWQLLHDRVPTKENLRVRGILPHESGGNCVWCPDVGESSSHLFIHCKVAMVVWYEIFKWLGVVIVMPQNLFHLYDYLSDIARSKKTIK